MNIPSNTIQKSQDYVHNTNAFQQVVKWISTLWYIHTILLRKTEKLLIHKIDWIYLKIIMLNEKLISIGYKL